MIYSYNKSQQDALFLNFILVKNSICLSGYVNTSSMTNTSCCEYSIKAHDHGL